MPQPIPTDPAGKRALHGVLQREAPDILAEVAALRQQFPGAKIAYIKTESVECGVMKSGGVSLDDMDLPAYESPEQKAAKAKLKAAAEKRQAALRKKR